MEQSLLPRFLVGEKNHEFQSQKEIEAGPINREPAWESARRLGPGSAGVGGGGRSKELWARM